MTDTQPVVTQEDRDAAADWTFIECMRCSEYEGDFGADLAADFAAHRTASTAALQKQLDIAVEALERVESGMGAPYRARKVANKALAAIKDQGV